MNEQQIINIIVFNHGNYHKFGDEQYFEGFKCWMVQLQKLKGFKTIEQTIDYYQAVLAKEEVGVA